jgi:hypothetical protein
MVKTLDIATRRRFSEHDKKLKGLHELLGNLIDAHASIGRAIAEVRAQILRAELERGLKSGR